MWMRHIQGSLSWFGSHSHLFCPPVCALGWILQSHRCVQWSYTMVLVSSTGSPWQCHRQGTLSIPCCPDPCGAASSVLGKHIPPLPSSKEELGPFDVAVLRASSGKLQHPAGSTRPPPPSPGGKDRGRGVG